MELECAGIIMCLAEQFGSPGNERIACIFRSGHVPKVDGGSLLCVASRRLLFQGSSFLSKSS
jgi:hypothetical protein